MRLDPADARRRFVASPVARLATVTPAGTPRVVPVCFVAVGDRLFSAVDDKPKRTAALARLDNLRAQPAVSLLVDHYEEDWTALWWARADGDARILDDGPEHADAIAALRDKYAQYRDHRLTDAVLAIEVTQWSGWAAAP